jgi:two-component sensor histidine kinase
VHHLSAFLNGGGRAAATIAQIDWSKNPMGPIAQWPQSLKTALGMMLSSHFPKAIAWGPELITFHNDAFEPILGDKPPAVGRPFSEVWAEVWPDLEPMVKKVFAGQATFIENFPLVIDRHGYPEQVYFTFCYSPIRIENGEVGGFMDTVIETTETVEAQSRLAVTNAELAHRMGNLLTMVSAVTAMSLRHARDLDDARASLSQRLVALGRNQSMLLADAASEARINDLIEQALTPHPTLRDRVSVSGPEFSLKSSQALALSLALNELITNSIKYGALSSDDGAVEVRWDPAGFSFSWKESGAKSVVAPTRQGFGTKVLIQFVSATFKGCATIDFDDDGLRYELIAPADAVRLSP